MAIAFLVFDVWLRCVIRELQSIFYYVETCFRVVMFFLTIIFVFGFVNDCWCAPPWQWQIGALAIFMAYVNLLFLLKGLPWLGVYINMLFHVIVTFLTLIYLPIILIIAFAIPFYMLLVRDSDAVLVSVHSI